MGHMKIDFEFDACAICRRRPADSWEHVIPEWLGGRLQCNFLCAPCNASLGSRLIAQLKDAPQIRIALDNLKREIPKLYESAARGTYRVARGPDEQPITIKLGKRGAHVSARKAADGSLLINTREASGHLERMLERSGLDPQQVEEFLGAFKAASEDEVVDSGAGIAAVKRPLRPSEPDLSKPLCDDRVPGVIAFGYLCLAFGNAIMSDHFNGLRVWLEGGDLPEAVTVSRSFIGTYESHHFIAMRAFEEEVAVQIHLFGGLVYQVNIGRLAYRGDCPVYLEDLKSRKSLLAPTEAKAAEGKYFVLNP
jgi:hypothetical protein